MENYDILEIRNMITEIYDFMFEYKEDFLDFISGYNYNDEKQEEVYPTKEDREKRFDKIIAYLESI